MFVHGFAIRVVFVLVGVVLLWALFATDSGASGPAARYVVKPGDTLWSIAAAHMSGDPREAVWKIERRNRLSTVTIAPGQVLVLPS